MKSRYKIKEGEISNLIKHISDNYCLPKISNSLVLYAFDQKYVIELLFVNSKISCRFNKNRLFPNLGDNFEERFSYIDIQPEDLRFFIRMIARIGFNQVNINRTVLFEFRTDNELVFKIQGNTFIGDIIHVYTSKKYSFLEIYCERETTQEEVLNILNVKVIKSENLINEDGKINSIIYDYCHLFGVNISETPYTMALAIGSKSNDYSIVNEAFKLVTNRDISGLDVIEKRNYNLPGEMSVIIPWGLDYLRI